LYADLGGPDDRIETDTSFFHLTNASPESIDSITWNTQPEIIELNKIPILPPFRRIGLAKIDATNTVRKIMEGSLANNVFLFKLKVEDLGAEFEYKHRIYRGPSTPIAEEVPVLELIVEKPCGN
jgi:hypothetical protein